jgi:hypothetical protein
VLVVNDDFHGRILTCASNRFNVQLRVFESESSNSPLTNETIDVDVCYSQVNQTWPVAICTQPMNGFKQGSKFWYGNAASQVLGANATKHSLLDEFVVIHAMQVASPPHLSPHLFSFPLLPNPVLSSLLYSPFFLFLSTLPQSPPPLPTLILSFISPLSHSSFLFFSLLSSSLHFPHAYPTTSLHIHSLHLSLPQGARVNVNDFDGSLAAPMRKYAGNPSVSYRPGWSLPDMYSGNGEQQSVMYETHAETACMWEHRIRAKWVQIIHSADNMASPISPHKTMAQVADSLDTQAVSAVLVPTCRESFPLAAADEYYWAILPPPC